MIRFLAEDLTYKVYSLHESVYLKRKEQSRQHADYEARDLCIATHYGDPTSALILSEYIIVAGCGLSIFTLATRAEIHLFAEPAAIRWTNGLHQDDLDSNLDLGS